MKWLRRVSSTLDWFKRNHELASWTQAVGVIIALVFGAVQLRQATNALESSATNNKIALRNNTSDLLVGINEAALNHPETAGGYSGIKRVHLMRLHYFYRTFLLRHDKVIDEETFEAETTYLQWATKLPDFSEVWHDFRQQYRSDFRAWVEAALAQAQK